MTSKQHNAYWRKLLGQARVSLTGASDVELRVQIFDVLEEFFDGSNCWQESIKFTVVPNYLDYPVQPITGRIIRLLGAFDQNNVPQQAVMPVIGQVRFLYPYTNTQPMTVVVVKNVTDPLECFPPYIPEWVVPVHGRVLLRGLLGYMMGQPGQSYSNPPQAAFHLQRFRDGVAKARVAAMKMNTIGVQNWAFPQSHRTSSQKSGISTFNVNPTPR